MTLNQALLRTSLVCCLITVASCASINSVSLTPIPAQRDNRIQAEVSKTIFLGFSFDNDFVDPLVDNLKKKCPGGLVSGILTKDEVISYFIVFTRKVTATGYCNKAMATNSKAKKSASYKFGDDE